MLFQAIFVLVSVAAASSTEVTYEELVQRLDQQQRQIETLRSIVTSQAKARVHDQVQARKPGVHQPVPDVAIYFSASISATLEITASGVVNYDDIILNSGDLYGSDGKFTCPVSGYYAFSLSAKSDALRVADVHIVLDDGSAATVVASAMSVDGYDHASNSVVVECTAGNTVYVQGGTYGGALYAEAGSRYNTFAGQLLWVKS